MIGTSTGPSFTYNWTNVPAGNYALTARATDNSGATTTSTPVNVTVTATPVIDQRRGAANGGVATASSTYTDRLQISRRPAPLTVALRRLGHRWHLGRQQRDVFPDWMQITFSGSKTIDRIDVFTVQDDTHHAN